MCKDFYFTFMKKDGFGHKKALDIGDNALEYFADFGKRFLECVISNKKHYAL